MKQYTHAWLAFMAIKRLETANILYKEKADKKKNADIQAAAASLVKWFKDYRDFVIKGAWYPDEVFKDMATSHVIKYQPLPEEAMTKKRPKLYDTSEMPRWATKSEVYNMGFDILSGNCADRCEALSHGIVDSLKMQFLEAKGNPISPTNNHLAIRFFILSHYIADCHMPLHCDNRSFSKGSDLHGKIEKNWEDQIIASFKLDKDNLRFFYDPEGYPLKTDKVSPLVKRLEEDLTNRTFLYEWPTNINNCWDYMSAVSLYSYYMSYCIFPYDYDMTTKTAAFKESDIYKNLDEYSFAILSDAIDSIARIWLHAWHRFLDWPPYKQA